MSARPASPRTLLLVACVLAGALLTLPGLLTSGSAIQPISAPARSDVSPGSFAVSTFASNLSGNCSASRVAVLPHFVAHTDTFHTRTWSELNVSGACTSGMTVASASSQVNLSMPLPVKSSTHAVVVNLTGSYVATERLKVLAKCRVTSGCEIGSTFDIAASVMLWDNTTRTGYCDGSNISAGYSIVPFLVCGPEVSMYDNRCAPFTSYLCFGSSGGNARVSSNFASRLFITNQTQCSYYGCYYLGGAAFNSSDQYALEITIIAVTQVYSDGWNAVAFASTDLTADDGVSVGQITLV
jgi:hypothetical protein